MNEENRKVFYKRIIVSLQEINEKLSLNLMLKDILSIQDNRDVFQREILYFGGRSRPGSIFSFPYKEKLLIAYSKDLVSSQLEDCFKAVHISGEVDLSSLSLASKNNSYEKIKEFTEKSMLYSFEKVYISDSRFICEDEDNPKLFKDHTEDIFWANNFMGEKEIPLKDLVNDVSLTEKEKIFLRESLREYSGVETLKKGVSLFQSDIPRYFPIGFWFPIFFLYSDEVNDLGGFEIMKGENKTGYLNTFLFNSLPYSKEKIGILKMLGLKYLGIIRPNLLGKSFYEKTLGDILLGRV